jgi:hypothetical protein
VGEATGLRRNAYVVDANPSAGELASGSIRSIIRL